ncbi:C4-dicarboxylate ABC transporter permease [Thioclava sp. SK-1]|uniref:tripartite tricarboxylate transporter TctB family protein n=1 Tax=Thioclava sp. SK-1 TaxID=1889770 RepID=UPI000826D1B5|nr:tripartite tricarboxylate transporter TctB family protein [Thioclava sp. SK-1]OCX65750.1 C4-dicarboxylate ABC transporter permease [Thioclava sp. SK-1]
MLERKGDIWIGCGLLAFCAFAAWRSTMVKSVSAGTSAGPTFVPWLMIAGIAILALALVIRALRSQDLSRVDLPEKAVFIKMAALAVLMVAYAAAFMAIGYLPATLTVFVIGLWLFDERRWLVLTLVPVGITGVVYLGFTEFLNVWLP